MARYELPGGLSPREQRVALAALERLVELERPRLTAWTLAGRAEALRIGSLHARHQARDPWAFRARLPFAPGGTQPQVGRGDSR
ncbi:MAG TPA: hypothetical protein VGB51_09795 [Actinomycetota bacterium]